jgi:hypothetical protein
MRIQATAATPPGIYTLTVQGGSAEQTATATTIFTVQSTVPVTPTPTNPADGADGVSRTPSLAWVTDNLGATYTLEIFQGKACAGPALHTYQSGRSPFVVPESDQLASYSDYSWRVTATNQCGADVSPCAGFRTESCSESDGITNGGFEAGLSGWSSDLLQPPPVVTTEQPHSGTSALKLGTLTGRGSVNGTASVSQLVTLPPGSSSNLVFWMWGSSTDPFMFDQQFVTVTPVLPAGATSGVTQFGFGGGTTGMFVDDVSVGVANCGPPDFALRVYPVSVGEVCAGSSVDYTVAVDSVHGPNFTSLVTLGATGLPPGTTATFAQGAVAPGQTTVLTLHTTRPVIGKTYSFNVTGVAVTPPPDGTRSATATVLLDANAPAAPPIVSPKDGDTNLPRRPTLSWASPFVPDAPLLASGAGSSVVAGGATEYFWRVRATNACGVGPYSKTSRFLVGACSEG